MDIINNNGYCFFNLFLQNDTDMWKVYTYAPGPALCPIPVAITDGETPSQVGEKSFMHY